ncbi:hypothetical protein [Spartinivicinus poritis]|uniref:Uncharacterized protein n=1 Tax=Spartinivicinus poritis TaxID=2994640 RepID=A0ABT5U744_9GAMM|nr:hypothetical protein [Spartinivicinus sp. A2-2]MDE1462188.1 hypothetical protein [Spartinivicinus sp. A2-2]
MRENLNHSKFTIDVAGWHWHKHNLSAYADNDDIRSITRRINGGLNGLADREAYLIKAKLVLSLS